MRRCSIALAILAAGCGRLLEDSLLVEDVEIESPGDGATVLGRAVFPVEISVECDDVQLLEVRFEDWTAGAWIAGDPPAPGCSGRPHTYCVAAEIAIPLGLGSFWPARMQASLACAHRPGEFQSATREIYLAPFEALTRLPATARMVFRAPGGGVITASTSGVHRVGTDGQITGLTNRSSAARAFAVGGDLYYYAPCEQLACDAAAPDLFRVDAATLAPSRASTRLGCAPSAIMGLGDRRVIALGGCDAPAVRWAAPDLAIQAEEAVDVRLTERVARRGDQVIALAWRGDELVIVAAGAAPPLAIRPTGVHGQGAALSDDATRAAVLDTAGRLVHIDTASGAVVASTVAPLRAPGDLVAVDYAPGTHRVVVAFVEAWWVVDGDASPPAVRRVDAPSDDDGTPFIVRAAAPLDRDRTLVIADPQDSLPARRLVSVTDGTTTALQVWVGGDWRLTTAPLVTEGNTLHLAFDTRQGPVIVRHHLAAP